MWGLSVNQARTFSVSADCPNWLPTLDSKQYSDYLSKHKIVHVLVKMYRRRGRGVAISLYDPLPALARKPEATYKNIVAIAIQVKEYLKNDPQRTYTTTGKHFGVTRSRISQLMTILEKLPDDFIYTMKTTEDQSLLKRFSGKTLLKIAAISGVSDRNIYVRQILASLE